jgi:hypothetical protein
MIISFSVTYHSIVVDRLLVATADRAAILDTVRQVFDEFGLRVHKQDTSSIVHWPGGLGRATRAAAILTNTPESYYRFDFASLGIPGYTSVHIKIRLVHPRWFGGRQKATERVKAFFQKLSDVSAERGVGYIERSQFDAYLTTT